MAATFGTLQTAFEGREDMLKRLPLLAIIMLCLGIAGSCARGTSEPDGVSGLDSFLRAYFEQYLRYERDTPDDLTFLKAATDLNGDNVDELLVYLTSLDFCGSGGCTLLILTPRGSSYRVVTRMTVVKLPIRALDTRSHGWRNLSVTVQGGGILEGYEAELPYDGESYPTNPSMPPARRLEGAASGDVLIERDRQGAATGENLIAES